ncbi:hypothetical protein BASA50_003005 [Batrachochytrium salamandrivorans]|uniref:chitin synthase n=1 Tax=Batrachochytrium salamandrivorans TaxID=1357716 RepID=A0ABQ8FJR6_9FUNG|nr:hypothetical protein BASA50_003005 [Batrachochytrium salamandrivorans]
MPDPPICKDERSMPPEQAALEYRRKQQQETQEQQNYYMQQQPLIGSFPEPISTALGDISNTVQPYQQHEPYPEPYPEQTTEQTTEPYLEQNNYRMDSPTVSPLSPYNNYSYPPPQMLSPPTIPNAPLPHQHHLSPPFLSYSPSPVFSPSPQIPSLHTATVIAIPTGGGYISSSTPPLPQIPYSQPGLFSHDTSDPGSHDRRSAYVHANEVLPNAGSTAVAGHLPYQVETDTIDEYPSGVHSSHDTVFGNVSPNYNYPPAQQYIPRRMGATLFRYKTVKTIPLTPSGNFVVEVPVPEKVFNAGQMQGREFSHLRYTAVVGDPNEFYERGYYLRQGEEDRSTEIFIVVTMYNEDETLFLKTWKSLRRNINHLCRKTNSDVWGPEGWKKVVICIVSDGRSKINQKTLATLGVLGVYQEGLIKTSINDQEVSAHVFEYTSCVTFDNQINIKKSDISNVPVQVLFCLKEKNAKKINSHRWFFNAFGRILNPNICVLLDVGTKPTDRSIYYLWREFSLFPNVAGACGEIYAEQGAFSSKLLNPLVAAQNFEYKMSNILDKPLESVFGFISVLPGAFSAYRYKALQNRGDGVGPLEKYFIGEKMHGGPNLTMANMYLAEDRILCFELVTKRDEAWILRYVKRAKAETDVPDSVPEYISQRRRWLNGSFFAGLHAIIHFYQVFRSGHTFTRKMVLLAQILYNVVNLIFNWLALSIFFLTFYFLSGGVVQQASTDPFYGFGVVMFITLRQLYLFALVMIFIASLGNRPQGSRLLYTGCFVLFALIMATLLYMSGFTIHLAIQSVIQKSTTVNPNGTNMFGGINLVDLLSERAFRDLVLSLATTYGVYFIASLVHGNPWHMVTSFIQYLLLLPSFVNILMVYAFCNLHDVSWGTKGDNKPTEPAAAVHAQKTESGDQVVTVDLPVNQTDIDAHYNLFLKELRPNPGVDVALKRELRKRNGMDQEDYFRAFRTQVVLFWLLSNVVLVAVFTTSQIALQLGVDSSNPKAFNPFLTTILWSVAGLSMIRFIGSMTYICCQNRKW